MFSFNNTEKHSAFDSILNIRFSNRAHRFDELWFEHIPGHNAVVHEFNERFEQVSKQLAGTENGNTVDKNLYSTSRECYLVYIMDSMIVRIY